MTNPNRYLPAGSDVAVQTKKGPPRWYKTLKDVDVTAAPVPAVCPMRTGRQVLKITHENVDVFFLPNQLATRFTTDQAELAQKLRFRMLDYDVPDVIPDNADGDAYRHDGHPSDYLARIAVRSTLSCWIIPDGQMQGILTRLNRLTRIGGKFRSYLVDPSEAVAVLNDVVNALENDIDFAAKSAESSQQSATATLETAPADADPMKAQKRFLYRAKQIQTVAKERLDNAFAAAKVFGVTDRLVGRARAESVVDSVATAMAQRARLFADAVATAATANVAGGGAGAVAAAADAGEMPVGVLADFIQENVPGGEKQAETLRAAFGLTAPAPVEPVADENGVFSLDGVGTDEPDAPAA